MGVHPKVKDLSRNLGEKRSHCWNFKSLFHILLPFSLCGSNRSGIAWGCLTNWHLPLCLRPEGSGEERRPGKFNKSVPFAPTFCKVSFPWKWGFDAWGVREAWSTSWLRRVICSTEIDDCTGARLWENAGPRRGRETWPPRLYLVPAATYIYTLYTGLTVITAFIPKPLLPPRSPGRRQPLAGMCDK